MTVGYHAGLRIPPSQNGAIYGRCSSQPERFKVNINPCWKKLDEYYSRLDETPLYYAAIAFHLAYRREYFEDRWADRPNWTQIAKPLVEGLYLSHYEPQIVSQDRERGEPVTKKRRMYQNHFDEYR
jgi:hypothetical protein